MAQKLIFTTPDGGVAVVHPTGEVPIDRVAAQAVPSGVEYDIVTDDAFPADLTFRDAWRIDTPGHVCEDLEACKEIAHSRRRVKREEEFRPHDEAIAKRIPGIDEEAEEAQRTLIREKYEAIQAQVDGATDPDALRLVISEVGI